MPVSGTYSIRGASPTTAGDTPSPTGSLSIPQLLKNPLAQRYFKAIPSEITANYYKRFDIFQNLPNFLKTKMDEIEKQGAPAIVAAAKGYLNIYLIESKYVIPPHLTPANPKFIEDYFGMEPNGKFDLGQFLSEKLSYLHISEDKWKNFRPKMERDFVLLYTALRAAEIICAAQNQPAINPPASAPAQI